MPLHKSIYIHHDDNHTFSTTKEDLTEIDVYENGRAIRYFERFAKEGVNVNFV